MHLPPNPLTTLLLLLLLALALLSPLASAQFGFFDQMFGGGGGGGGGGQQQQHQHQHQHQQGGGGPQNVPSDPSFYQSHWERMRCDKYLCPDTLACVHFPHHCPCAFPANEDKFETGEGHRICASKGGFRAGEAARKVELARKGML